MIFLKLFRATEKRLNHYIVQIEW